MSITPYQEAKEQAIDEFERWYIVVLLSLTGGVISEAARKADMDRTTIYRLIEKHNIDLDSIRS